MIVRKALDQKLKVPKLTFLHPMNVLLAMNYERSNEECEALSTSVKNYKLSIREFRSSPIYLYT